jgi:hypothetical protein
VYVEGDIRVGKRYWLHPRTGAPNWDLARGYLSLATDEIRPDLPTPTVVLYLPIKSIHNVGPLVLRAYSHGGSPYGEELEEDEWDTCDLYESQILVPEGAEMVWMPVPSSSISRSSPTQIRLRHSAEGLVDPPTGDHYVLFRGPGDAEGEPYLMVNTHIPEDDVPENIAEILEAKKATLGVEKVWPMIRHQVTPQKMPEIQIGWAGTAVGDHLVVSATIYWMDRVIEGPSGHVSTQDASMDKRIRIGCGKIRKAIRADGDCQGYCTGIENISAGISVEKVALGDSLVLAGSFTVGYRMEIGDYQPYIA